MKNICGVRSESHRKRRGESGIQDQQAHPAIEKCSERTKTFAQVDVRSAGAGESASQFTKTERAAQRHGADGEPDDEQPEGRRERFGHPRGREEDANGDSFAGDDCSGGTQAELAAETFLRWRSACRGGCHSSVEKNCSLGLQDSHARISYAQRASRLRPNHSTRRTLWRQMISLRAAVRTLD